MSQPTDLDELADLPRALDPPEGLEERVLGALRARRLVRPEPPRRLAAWTRLAAACLLAALLGWTARGLIDRAAPHPGDAVATQGGEYLLLLLEPTPLRTSKPLDSLVAEYRAWAKALAADGRLVAAGRLEGDGRYMAEGDGSPAAGIATVSGFFVVRATSLAAAEEVAATCPHLGYGGAISVREVAGPSAPPAS